MLSKMIKITLTNPPVLNKIYRVAGSRVYKTKEAKTWQQMSGFEIMIKAMKGNWVKSFTGFVSVDIKQYPPDKRRRDSDGILKLLFDAIQDSGVIEDDYQIADYHVRRHEPDKENPRLEVMIKELKEK